MSPIYFQRKEVTNENKTEYWTNAYGITKSYYLHNDIKEEQVLHCRSLELYWSDDNNWYIHNTEGDTPTEAIQKTYDYCIEQEWIKEEEWTDSR